MRPTQEKREKKKDKQLFRKSDFARSALATDSTPFMLITIFEIFCDICAIKKTQFYLKIFQQCLNEKFQKVQMALMQFPKQMIQIKLQPSEVG